MHERDGLGIEPPIVRRKSLVVLMSTFTGRNLPKLLQNFSSEIDKKNSEDHTGHTYVCSMCSKRG